LEEEGYAEEYSIEEYTEESPGEPGDDLSISFLQDAARRRHAGLWHTCPVECDRFGDCDTKDW